MQKITTFLTFNNQAEEAVNFYVSVFENAEIENLSYYPKEVPGMGGKLMSATFQLHGQKFIALNGGSGFSFSQGISLFVNCETQEEVDHLWDNLSEDGEPQQCGWLKDKFGVSWQIIPSILGRYLSSQDREKAGRVMNAMLQMKKIDIEKLEQAYQNTK